VISGLTGLSAWVGLWSTRKKLKVLERVSRDVGGVG